MRALMFDTMGGLRLTADAPDPRPAPGEALIRLRLAGICHTDLELTRGYMGFRGILGHEFVGELAQDVAQDATSAHRWRAGQRVIGEINVACGQCDFCGAGIPSQCRNRRTLGIDRCDGAFADGLCLPARNLHPVPDDVPDEAAVFAEPLAAALQIPALAPISPNDRVILIGAGKLGLLAAQVLRLTGCDLRVIARQDKPIRLLQKWGIPYDDARRSAWRESVPERSADVVVDCTGSAEGFALALTMVRPRGAIVLKSTYAGLPQADLTRIVVDEIRVIGSRCGPFPAALRLLQAGLVDVQSMIEHTYPLADALAAFAHAARQGVLKVLLRP